MKIYESHNGVCDKKLKMLPMKEISAVSREMKNTAIEKYGRNECPRIEFY
ncbi:MAG: hypothetical protein QXL15_00160 [Candidatus Korarchaeota archaeon]